MNGLQQIENSNPVYVLGKDGSGGECDCIGLVIGSIRRAGGVWKNTHGSNYAARFEMNSLERLISPDQLKIGDLVYKAKEPNQLGYLLPKKYQAGGNSYTGDVKDYYHVGIIKSIMPLEIVHCTKTSQKSGIHYDKTIKGWMYFGELGKIDYLNNGGGSEMELTAKIKDIPENNDGVRLRKSPNTNAATIVKIPEYETVAVTSKGDMWSVVKWRGDIGHMMTKFLEFETSFVTISIPRIELNEAEVLKSKYPDAEITQARGV